MLEGPPSKGGDALTALSMSREASLATFAYPARPDAFVLRTLGLHSVKTRDDGIESGQFCLFNRRNCVIDRGSSAPLHDVCVILGAIDVDLMLSLLHS